MAKAATKPTGKGTPKPTVPAVKKSAKASSKAPVDIEKTSQAILAKLQALNLDSKLQADLEWCLGSYRSDKNPVGLYQMLGRALQLFESEQKKKTKGITLKLIGDVKKVVK